MNIGVKYILGCMYRNYLGGCIRKIGLGLTDFNSKGSFVGFTTGFRASGLPYMMVSLKEPLLMKICHMSYSLNS